MSAAVVAPVATPARRAWDRFRRDRWATVALVVFGLFALAAVVGQGVELWEGGAHAYDLTARELGLSELDETAYPPAASSWLLWLGTTSAGKSVLMRVFFGTKVAFVVGTLGAGLAASVGLVLGLLAGYFGRWVDQAVVYVYSTLDSIPYLLLMLALAFVVRQGPVAEWYRTSWLGERVSIGLFNLVVVIGLTSWVSLCRLVRAEVLKVRELDFVQAARALGMGEGRILFRHVLPNVLHLVIVNFSLTFVVAIKSEVILTFLGVGVDQEPSWGQMIADAQSELTRGIWWPLLASGTLLFVLTLTVNLLGDGLRDALDPKLRARD